MDCRKSYLFKIRNLNQTNYKELRRDCRISKDLYNQSLYEMNKFYERNQKSMSHTDLYHHMKYQMNLDGDVNFLKLKNDISNQVLKKLCKNFVSFFRLIKDYNKNKSKYKGVPRPPKYLKKNSFFMLVYRGSNLLIKENTIYLNYLEDKRLKKCSDITLVL